MESLTQVNITRREKDGRQKGRERERERERRGGGWGV